MSQGHFADRCIEAIKSKKSILCVGLDPQIKYFPPDLVRTYVRTFGHTREAMGRLIFEFNRRVILAVKPFAFCVKPQSAFYEQYGHHGIRALEETIEFARQKGLLVILDAKRGDGGDTADAYASTYLGDVHMYEPEPMPVASGLRVNALTVHGYIGDDCVTRFAERCKKHGTGIFVVTKTSFKPCSRLEMLKTESGKLVWEEMACMVDEWGNDTEGACGFKNVGAVIGATYPRETVLARARMPHTWFLVPGYGAQGGGSDGAVLGADDDGFGITVNSSRGITYPWASKDGPALDPDNWDRQIADAAKHACEDLNAALKRAGKGRAFL